MKIEFNKAKSAEALSTVARGTADIGKKIAESVKNKTTIVVEKTKSDTYARRLKKFNPLFPDQYNDVTFNLPNIIVIVDDATRKDIDVCEGAIGWLGKENGVEILYLYDEAIQFCGIQFIPAAICDAVYYVDSFDRHKFIKADCYFRKVQEERSAELEHIACCLGAKWCSVEIVENQKASHSKKRQSVVKEQVKGVSCEETIDQNSSATSKTELHSRNYSKFQGNSAPQKPTLKWFAHDSTIQQLIDSRCTGDNSITIKELDFYGSSFSTMSRRAACAIDCALATMDSISGGTSMENQASQEQESRLIFRVEF